MADETMTTSESIPSAALPGATMSRLAEERLRRSLANLRLEVEETLRRASPVRDAAGNGDGFEATIRAYMTALRRLFWRNKPFGEA